MKKTSAPRTLVSHPEPQSHYSLPVFRVIGEPPKNLLERALSIFADVRAGEGLSTVLLAVNIFLLLAGYSLMKPARDGLILTEGGAEVASYSAAAQAVLLMAAVPIYGWLGTRVVRIRLIAIVVTFFSATLLAFYAGGLAGLREGVAFYVWIGLINVFIVSQFWQFSNDLFTEAQGRRLFPLIGVGQSLGAWVGAAAVAPLVRQLNYTPYTLMLIGAGVLMLALYKGRASNKFGLLTGSIVSIDATNLWVLGGVAVVVIAVVAVLHRQLLFASADAEVATARGVPVRMLSLVFAVLIGLVTALAVPIVGAILVLSVMIAPGAAAARVTANPLLATALAVAFAELALVGGTVLSLAPGLPVSGYVAAIAFACYVVCRIIGRTHGGVPARM